MHAIPLQCMPYCVTGNIMFNMNNPTLSTVQKTCRLSFNCSNLNYNVMCIKNGVCICVKTLYNNVQL